MNKIFTVALSALIVVAIMTSVVSAFQIVSATATHSGHGHTVDNGNNLHSNGGVVENSDGSHTNAHCVQNSNNDQGLKCHTNTH